MMHDMHRPTPTDAVAYAVVHVEPQIVEDKAQDERSPSDGYIANGKGGRCEQSGGSDKGKYGIYRVTR
jgi:hypothetical protein